MLAYATDPVNSSPTGPLRAPWDHCHPGACSSLPAVADDDADLALRHVTDSDFRYARREAAGTYDRPATHCRDCCSVERSLAAAETSSHPHHYQQLYP